VQLNGKIIGSRTGEDLSGGVLAADENRAGALQMKLRQMTSWGKEAAAPVGPELAIPNGERCLTPLVEGTATSMLAIDDAAYHDFRERVSILAVQMRDGLPDADKLALIRSVLHEFEQYRKFSEDVLRERLSGWRTLVSKVLVDLLTRTGIDPASGDAATLVQRVASLLTATEIHGFLTQLADYLRVGGGDGQKTRASHLSLADRTNANDNAAGLRGGGVAVEHVRKIMKQGNEGFVVLFQLNCLDIIGERFGMEAVQDSLMAVSAFLTHSLRSDDAVYHWTGSSLLAVLETPATPQILIAAMRRIVDNNRDITIQMGGRSVMLRIPLEFEITAINRLSSAEDLHKLSAPSAKKW
jgi:GGDEF domain-containing protein